MGKPNSFKFLPTFRLDKFGNGIILCAGLALMLVGSGFIFGWASLSGILVKEGTYSELCPNGVSPCDAQTLRLNLIFTMATFALLASALPAGLLLDRFGARKVTLCASSLVALGSAMMAVSNSKSISFVSAVNSNSVARPLYIPAYCLMGIGGNTVGMGLFTLGKLCKKHQAAIVGAFTANWNASPIVLLIFSVLYVYAGVPFKALFLGFLAVPALLALLTVFWPPKDSTIVREPDEERGVPLPSESGEKSGSVLSYVRTRAFILATVFLAGEALFVNAFIGTVSYQANHFASQQLSVDLVYAFGVIFPVGQLLCAPIAAFALEKSILWSYFVTAASGVLLGLVAFLQQFHWSILLINFAVFSLWRSFLYCTTWAFVTKKFGFECYGTLAGIMNTTSGILSLVQYGLLAIIASGPHGFTIFCACQIVIMVALSLIPVVFLVKRDISNE